MGNFEQKKRNKDYSFGSAVESVLSLLRAVKATPASKRPVEKYLKERAEKHRRSRLPHRSLSELPEDLQEAFRLKKRLEKLERENGYISAGTWQGLLQTGQKELQDLQVLREKQVLELYCQKNGLHSARRVEEVLDLCGFTGKKHADLISAEGLEKGVSESGSEANGEANSEIGGGGSGQPAWVRAHNARYLEHALEEERDYLDHVLDAVDPQIRLDQAQRRMVLTDEDNCLVIAGAGAGKTTSVAAKVKYLVDRKGVKPEEILVISFTNKAVEELRAHGVDFHPRSDEEILRKILQNEGNRYIRRLVMLICRFITNFKTDGYTEMQFAVMKESTQNVRTKRRTGEAFLGCTNFTRDGKGCGRTMGWPEYQQKMRYEPGYRNAEI